MLSPASALSVEMQNANDGPDLPPASTSIIRRNPLRCNENLRTREIRSRVRTEGREFNLRQQLPISANWPQYGTSGSVLGLFICPERGLMTSSLTILRLPAVRTRCGLSRSSIYLQISKGSFPKPISLGARAVGWLAGDIDGWLAERVAVSRPAQVAPTTNPEQPRP